MGLGGLLVVAAALPPLTALVAWPTWALAGYALWIIDAAGSAPGALVPVGGLPDSSILAATITILGLGALALPDLRLRLARVPLPGRRAGVFTIGAALLTLTVVPAAPLMLPSDGRLRAWTLDLGGSAALLARTESGRTVVIAPEASPARLSDALARHLRPWEARLGALVLGDRADRSGLDRVLARFPPDVLVVAADSASEEEGSGPVISIHQGQRVALDRDVWLTRVTDSDSTEAVAGWDLEYGLVTLRVANERARALDPSETHERVRAILLTTTRASAGWSLGAIAERAQLLIHPGAPPAGLATGRQATVVLSLTTHGEMHLETDGAELVVHPARCVVPDGASGCPLVIGRSE
jgi:hypothetical protein